MKRETVKFSVRMHERAFTLVEMLVVIGIIGILSAVLISQFAGANESARAAQCMSNLRNLAVAACNYGMTVGSYPLAGCYCGVYMDPDAGKKRYTHYYGWISDLDRDGHWHSDHKNGSIWYDQLHIRDDVSTYSSGGTPEDRDPHFAITNGSLWAYSGRTFKSYVCPSHYQTLVDQKMKPESGPWWSYVLNSYFGYGPQRKAGGHNVGGRGFASVNAPDRLLLFAELQYRNKFGNNTTFNVDTSTSSGSAVDPILQFDDGKTSWGKKGKKASNPEHIGFNHIVGKKQLAAHVAWADGHVSKLMLPRDASQSRLVELTKWLCLGMEVSFDGREYKREEKTEQDSEHE